jgi:hypothetical protein
MNRGKTSWGPAGVEGENPHLSLTDIDKACKSLSYLSRQAVQLKRKEAAKFEMRRTKQV